MRFMSVCARAGRGRLLKNTGIEPDLAGGALQSALLRTYSAILMLIRSSFVCIGSHLGFAQTAAD